MFCITIVNFKKLVAVHLFHTGLITSHYLPTNSCQKYIKKLKDIRFQIYLKIKTHLKTNSIICNTDWDFMIDKLATPPPVLYVTTPTTLNTDMIPHYGYDFIMI